jgi:hypothetical protein
MPDLGSPREDGRFVSRGHPRDARSGQEVKRWQPLRPGEDRDRRAVWAVERIDPTTFERGEQYRAV